MTEVAERPNRVPALAQTPATQITAEDLELRKLYSAQFISSAVTSQLVKPGVLFVAAGGDDPDPEVLWSPPHDVKKNPGVLFHVLGLRKGKSLSKGGELMLFDFDDPDAPPEANTTYNYNLVLPEVDPDMPFKWLVTRSATPAARKINTILAKNAISGPSWNSAFRVHTIERSNDKGKYFVPQVSVVDADPKHIAVAEALGLLFGSAAAPAPRGDQPAI